MDESQLNSPTVHGNTADLPMALASLIGLAGMETRVDHGEPGWLGAWLQDRCPQGFDLPEAEQLCRRINHRFDGIPMALRAHLSPATLAALFAELARLGWIRTVPVSGTYSNTASGVTLDGQFSTNDSVVTFSTVGCRAN
jgi:hypothetical protein